MLTVLDVGARGGPDPRWDLLGQDCHVVGVEADPQEAERLSKERFPVRWSCLCAALGKADETPATLFVTRKPGCCSLLPPNSEFLAQFPYGENFRVEKTIPITLTTVDTLCAQQAITPDVLKLDTQGTELDILQGATRVLENVVMIESEVEFNPLYVGQPLFGDLDAYLRTRGFVLLGLRRSAWRRSNALALGGTIVHGDALWVRHPLSTAQRTPLVAALRAYRQHDFASALGATVNGDSAPSLLQRCFARLSSRWPHRRIRAWIDHSRSAGAIDWHDPDFF